METLGMSDSGAEQQSLKDGWVELQIGECWREDLAILACFHYKNHHSSRAFSFALPLTVAVTICNYNVPKLSGETTT